MKKLFALTLLAIIFSQSSTLAGCQEDLDLSLREAIGGGVTIYVTNNSKNKINLHSIKLVTNNGDTKTYTISKFLNSYKNFVGNTPIKDKIKFNDVNLKKVSFSCTTRTFSKTAKEKQGKKARNTKIIFGIVFVLLILFFVYLIRTSRKKDIIEHNKTHKNKINTYDELEKIREKEKGRRLLEESNREHKEWKKEEAEIKKKEKEEKEEEKKRLQKEKKEEEKRLQEEKRLPREEIKTEKESSGSDLIASIKRLKKMYNDGNLNKAEFEKAKNKLLK